MSWQICGENIYSLLNIYAKVLVSNESPFCALWYDWNDFFKIWTEKKLSGDKQVRFGKVFAVS